MVRNEEDWHSYMGALSLADTCTIFYLLFFSFSLTPSRMGMAWNPNFVFAWGEESDMAEGVG